MLTVMNLVMMPCHRFSASSISHFRVSRLTTSRLDSTPGDAVADLAKSPQKAVVTLWFESPSFSANQGCVCWLFAFSLHRCETVITRGTSTVGRVTIEHSSLRRHIVRANQSSALTYIADVYVEARHRARVSPAR